MRSDPYAELPQKTEKYAGMATELHMGRKGISELWDFECFTNLHTLWLNNNHLHSLEGLDRNVRLLNLHCHGNKITHISDSLRHLKFLVNLTLNQNQLTDIDEVLSELRHLRNIQYLDLFDNPITQEDNYRLRVIGELPWVQTLDKHEVTQEEHQLAKKVLKKIQKSKNIMNKKNKMENFDGSFQAEEVPAPEIPPHIVDAIKGRVVARRVFLEKSLLAFDPQRRGVVDSDTFLQVCNQYGLLEGLTEEDIANIIIRYTSQRQMQRRADPRSLAHSATSGLQYKVNVKYPDFCRAVQTDELRTMRFDQWKMEPVAELSRGAKDLDHFVNTIREKRRQEFEMSKRKSLVSSNTNQFGLSATAPDGPSARTSTAPCSLTMTGAMSGAVSGPGGRSSGSQGIDSWLANTVRALVKAIAKEAGVAITPNGTTVPKIIGCSSIDKVLSQMQLHGKFPAVSSKVVRANVQALCDPEGKLEINTFCELVGCSPVVHIKKLPESAASASASTSSRKPSNRVPVPVISWVDIPTEVLHHVEKEKFAESASYLDALLRSGKGVNTKELFADTMKAATVGTRLMSTRDLNPKPPPVYTPHQLIAAAEDIRADVVILPRLHKKKSTDTLPAAEHEGSDPADIEAVWRKQFMALGLKKHELEFAIDRKKRSQTSKGVGVSSLSKSASNAYYGVRPVSQGEFVTGNHKSNWNTSTGTFLLQKTG